MGGPTGSYNDRLWAHSCHADQSPSWLIEQYSHLSLSTVWIDGSVQKHYKSQISLIVTIH